MSKLKKPGFLEYWADSSGKAHIINVFCKRCGEKIQHGHMMKNHAGVTIPVLVPLPDYAELYIAFENGGGTLRRKSTPLCVKCAKADFSPEELAELAEADTEVMKERYAQAGGSAPEVEEYLSGRKGMKMICVIGYCIPGYAIVGEGR